jgi:non-lysosomal glucosylceramidase
MALGGIGTGGFEIRQDGGFTNWSLFNNAPRFAGAPCPHHAKHSFFFKLWVRVENENPRLVLLQIEDSHSIATMEHHEAQYIFPWLSGVDTIRTTASFPFADLEFEQDGLPLRVSLRAWSPFIPGNVKDSALPVALFDIDIRSTSNRPVDVQVLAVLRNSVAYDQPQRLYRNTRVRDCTFSGILCDASSALPEAATTGTLCLASHSENSTAYMGWEHPHPYYERCLREFPLPEYDDTEGRNSLDKTTGKKRADPRCFVTLAAHGRLENRDDTFRRTFALAWHFPNNYAKSQDDIRAGYLEDATFPCQGKQGGAGAVPHASTERPSRLEGHYYSEFFDSAEAVARYALSEQSRLLRETAAFHRTFFDSSLPGFVLDQVNSQLNTLRTSTWLTRTRMFGVLEGLNPSQSFAGIATTDVAMYGQIAASLLFPELDRMTIDLWTKFQNANGSVIHSVSCNSATISPGEADGHRLDMPGQYVFMALRGALWSGDADYLSRIWPHAKRALAYVLRERDRNVDHLPDMEGIMCSYDNFPMFGVAPYVVTQWLAAVSLALTAAKRLGDDAFVSEYANFYEKGRATLELTTWNGRYFNLSSNPQPQDPDGHLGCLTDQIIGDGFVRQLGLPPIIDPVKAHTALHTILEMNYKTDQGLRNCQWPGDTFLHDVAPDCWVDQANTCWTGVELNFAAQLYYAGLSENAEQVIRNVDERHRRWGMVWDHQEFGGHYFRPLSALAIPNAFLGLSYDGESLRIAPARALPVGRWCVLLPGAYGTYFQTADGARLEIKAGEVRASTIEIPSDGEVSLIGITGLYKACKIEGRTVFSLVSI